MLKCSIFPLTKTMNIIFLYDADETNNLTVPSNREINITKRIILSTNKPIHKRVPSTSLKSSISSLGEHDYLYRVIL